MDQIGSDWIRLDQIGSDWIRMDQIGSDDLGWLEDDDLRMIWGWLRNIAVNSRYFSSLLFIEGGQKTFFIGQKCFLVPLQKKTKIWRIRIRIFGDSDVVNKLLHVILNFVKRLAACNVHGERRMLCKKDFNLEKKMKWSVLVQSSE